MDSYVLSKKADADIESIARATVEAWGAVQAETYLLGLHAAFQRLVEFPELGRDAGEIRPGYRRLDTASHAVFYRQQGVRILIVRVLHERMDFRRHL